MPGALRHYLDPFLETEIPNAMTRSHLPEVLRLEHGSEGFYSVTPPGRLIGLAIRPHPDKVDIEPSPIRFASTP